jgi:hypothetical protein
MMGVTETGFSSSFKQPKSRINIQNIDSHTLEIKKQRTAISQRRETMSLFPLSQQFTAWK